MAQNAENLQKEWHMLAYVIFFSYLCTQERATNKNKHMKNELNALIMEAMKNHDTVRTESLRAIKSAFLNWQTSKENAGK